jgi:hypothetical protein
MNSLVLDDMPRATDVVCTDDEISVTLADGRRLVVPIAWFPRLAHAPAAARARFELLGDGQGIHWPDVDEDVSVAGLVAGRPAAEYKPGKH